TGANGFTATHITAALLAQGFSVRGTVRSEAKGKSLCELYNSAAFSYVVVPDIVPSDAWDAPSVLDGVSGIAHIAAPIEVEETDPDVQLWLRPAVEGTLNLLRSACKAGCVVKRVVVIGSTAAITAADLKPVQYTANDWNDAAIRTLEKKGVSADPWTKYCASKTLSEKAAWKYVKEHRSELPFDLTYVLPSWIYGPMLLKLLSTARPVVTLRCWWGDRVRKRDDPKVDDATLASFSGSYSDVRDVARAFLDAFTRPELGGKRLI
ncbi:NAD(P)-binding protein, partial [Auricularia subglabra TFB-10046 SS5]